MRFWSTEYGSIILSSRRAIRDNRYPQPVRLRIWCTSIVDWGIVTFFKSKLLFFKNNPSFKKNPSYTGTRLQQFRANNPPRFPRINQKSWTDPLQLIYKILPLAVNLLQYLHITCLSYRIYFFKFLDWIVPPFSVVLYPWILPWIPHLLLVILYRIIFICI